LVKA
jgi:hypothetical protein